MKNTAYLKSYVKNHPDNKMAWYLLGKEYESAGQEGKAQYCYNQAGSVYEAFEATKIPADLWQEYQDKLHQESRRKEERKGLVRKIGIVLVFLLLLNLSSAYAPGQFATDLPVEDDSATVAEDLGLVVKNPSQDSEAMWPEGERNWGIGSPFEGQGTEFTASAYQSNIDNPYKSLEDLYGDKLKTSASKVVVLGMKQKAEWLIWSKEMPVVYELDKSPQDGVMKVQSYDPKACQCTPPDATKLQNEGKAWIERQETLAVLSTAIHTYKEQKGSWPESLDQLVQPFPDNWLAGSNPFMRHEFKRVLALQQHAGSKPQQEEEQHPSASEERLSSNPGGEPLYFKEPLRIVIDKEAHLLAVASGNIMLRSYKVGLGGDKTPDGTFKVSDKVINPNGKDDGDFGSRGMQLSDTNYAIHGTNEPDSIGKDESLGCIRMLKKDVEELFDLIPRGAKVEIGKGILPQLESVPKERFVLKRSQDQTNPHRTYHWLL
ncbi:L,D-transpeptidase [Paenibacillus sp. GM2]|uniref:L,D-transpeptidase n=1 Tax=Paenibacillus sp. GM2 TaxID=1622070 RepID=UPI000839A8E5|nr:L,D-transpeptidase [Paenibacillus sp. GM2]